MSQKAQKTELAQETIRDCAEALKDMMAIFRTYSGKHLDIDRGDFDVEFFRELHSRGNTIQAKLSSLAQMLNTAKEKAKP